MTRYIVVRSRGRALFRRNSVLAGRERIKFSPGGMDDYPGLYLIEINEGPGSGVKILNKPIPPAFRESVGYAEQNLYSRSSQLVGDKDPRHHEFSYQVKDL
jgi:hypothetical protein